MKISNVTFQLNFLAIKETKEHTQRANKRCRHQLNFSWLTQVISLPVEDLSPTAQRQDLKKFTLYFIERDHNINFSKFFTTDF